MYKFNLWLGLFVAVVACHRADGASLSTRHLPRSYFIRGYDRQKHDSIRILISDHLYLNSPYSDLYSEGIQLLPRSEGATLSLTDSDVEGVRELLARHGFQLESRPYTPPAIEDRGVADGNRFLVHSALQALGIDEFTDPLWVENGLKSNYRVWARKFTLVQTGEGGWLIHLEFSHLVSALSRLRKLNYAHFIHSFEERLWKAADRQFGQRNPPSPKEVDQEARLKFVEDELGPWCSLMQPFKEMDTNPETREVVAHGFMMALLTLEEMYFEERKPLIQSSDIVDVLNRFLVSAKWLVTPGDCGGRCLELVEKLSRYKDLVPYLELMLTAKLGLERGSSPQDGDIKIYARLKDSLTFEKASWGGDLKVAKILVEGPSSSTSTSTTTSRQISGQSVWSGLRFIDSWFAKYGHPTHDWQAVEGVPMESQRAFLEGQRAKADCEGRLTGHRGAWPKRSED
jgi:hypothetical protein